MKCHRIGVGVLSLLLLVGCTTANAPSDRNLGTAASDSVPFTINSSNRNLTIALLSEVGSLEDGATSLVSVVLTVGIDRGTVFDLMGQPDIVFYGDQRYRVTATDADAYHVYRDKGLSFLIFGEVVTGITLLGDEWICSNRLTGGLTLDEAVEILGDEYDVRPTEFKDFVVYNQYGISLEIYHSTNRADEVNITEFNYD